MANLEAIKEAVIYGKRKEAVENTKKALDEGADPQELIDKYLIPALDVVGEKFECRKIFVPEMMIAAKSMQSCIDIIKPLLKQEKARDLGVVVLGTVFGDLHDIGKNLVKLMLDSSGFTVIDLDVNVPADKFLESIRENNAPVVGISSLLTTGDPHVEETVKTIKQSDIGQNVYVVCGGAALTPEFVEQKCGADAYAKDAATGVKLIKKMLGISN